LKTGIRDAIPEIPPDYCSSKPVQMRPEPCK
jgi:hypothetical protein